MNLRKCLTCGCCVCLTLLLISSTNAQIKTRRPLDDDVPRDLLPKVNVFDRTDLFNRYPPLLRDGADNAQALLVATKNFYLKLKTADNEKPGTVSPENLQRASLVWFKAQLAVTKSRSDYIRAATEYLEREGIPVDRSPDE